MRDADVIVIGAGPGGLAAAASAGKKGADVLLIEREHRTGGILNQCIHDGFGLVRYNAQLTGPEYAARSLSEVDLCHVRILNDTMVIAIRRTKESLVVTAVSRDSVREYYAGSVILATGCRERTRGMIGIPGTRPAGIFSAGTAQNLINTKNVMVGRRAVILGTGDIGLIMARRLTIEGAEVVCAIEAREKPQGLARNVRQCIQDFGIPLYLSHTVTNVIGKRRLEAVIMSGVDSEGSPIPGSEKKIECDTLILSVGLIPENEVAQTAGVSLDKDTNSIITDEFLMTEVPGIFACGNCKGIMDLADYVSLEGEVAGENAAAYALNMNMRPSHVKGTGTAPKGMPEEGVLTCLFCPKGCSLRTEGDRVTGNGCRKGLEFAAFEKTAPRRVLTTTVKTAERGDLLPVRSEGYLPLKSISDIADMLRNIRVCEPVKEGQLITCISNPVSAKIVSQCNHE